MARQYQEHTGRIMLITDSGYPFYEDLYDFSRSDAPNAKTNQALTRGMRTASRPIS